MFDAHNAVRVYEKALAAIRTGRFDNKETFVHDYKDKVYRTKKDYTLNGLHWGYPDGIVYEITKEDPGGNASCVQYAMWATPARKKSDYIGGNSRYSIVKFKEIRAVIEKGIEQKLAEAAKDLPKEKAFLAAWKKIVEKKYKRYERSALRIEKEATAFKFILIKPQRFVTRGMGSFLEDIKKGTVSVSGQHVLDDLFHCNEKGGLNAIEIFKGPIIAGMFGATEFVVRAEHISASGVGCEQLADLVVVQK